MADKMKRARTPAAKRTTSHDEARRVLNALRSLVRTLRLADRSGLKKYGVGSAQIFVLHHLAAESPLSVNDLADRTATDQSTVSVVVNKLVEKGYVERRWAKDDARRAELTLTPQGRRLASRLPVPFQESFLAGVAHLPPRRVRELAETLFEILRAMGVEDDQPPMLFEDDVVSKRRRAATRKAPAGRSRGAS
jgi:DNA-binding MarR family transcriptional regulator